MTDTAQLLELAIATSLVTAYAVVWRRRLISIIRALALQGAAVAVVALLLGLERNSIEPLIAAVLVFALKAVLIPVILARRVRQIDKLSEVDPVVNIPTSLLAAGLLTLLAYATGTHIAALGSDTASRAVPAGIAIVLIGLLVLVTRRKAMTQIAGFLLLENGIALVAFLTTAGLPLVIELGGALDLLLVILVMQVITGRMLSEFGATDLNQLQELND
jgi:hydrogenase-4 component E